MSRFGKLPVSVPAGVEVTLTPGQVVVKGPKGTIERDLPRRVQVVKDGNELKVSTKSSTKFALSLVGTTRSHLVNMVHGVTQGWSKELEMVGSGYRAEVQGKNLVLSVGHSHPVTVTAPENINFGVEKMKIIVSGIQKDIVGQISAKVREVRPPEPYKGKGIHYIDEVIRRKPGKQAAKTV